VALRRADALIWQSHGLVALLSAIGFNAIACPRRITRAAERRSTARGGLEPLRARASQNAVDAGTTVPST
jgi:hypothetical protein